MLTFTAKTVRFSVHKNERTASRQFFWDNGKEKIALAPPLIHRTPFG
jgi:hypothetical protein